MVPKKLVSLALVFCLTFALLPTPTFAAGSGTMYKNFTEMTNPSNLVDGQTYIFLTQHYSSSDAVTTLSGGNATLTMTSTVNGGAAIMKSDGYDFDKYVSVNQAGAGFDTCTTGAIYYGAVSFARMKGTAGTGWYYWCDGSGVYGVGPFYAYTYDTVTFTDSDVVVTVNGTLGATDTVEKSDLTVKAKGYTVSDYTITDATLTPTDRSYALNIGGVTVSQTAGSMITFKSHDGTVIATELKTMGTPIYVPAADSVAKPGYVFVGWTITQGSGVVNYAPSSEFNLDTSTTLYAVWTPIAEYTVTINGASQQVQSGSKVPVPGYTPSRSTEYYNSGNVLLAGDAPEAVKKIDYVFSGWKNSATNQLWDFNILVTGSLTLVPDYSQTVSYKVTINGNAQYVPSGATVPVPAPGANPSKATEYFDGGNALLAGDGSGAVKKIDYAFSGWINSATNQPWDFSTIVTGPLTLVPAYNQSVSYKISFDKNNTDSGYTTADQWIKEGSHVAEITAPSTVVAGATTYYFAGWNTKQNGSGEFWNFYGDVVSRNLILYAQWTSVDSYNITFDDNLPDPKDDYISHTGSLERNGAAATGYVTSPVMSRVDYVFEGWYTSADCNASNAYSLNRTLSENNAVGLDTDHDKSIMLFAKWAPKYTSENDVLIASSALAGGTYADYYSDYIGAFENNASYNTPSATPVYRNFILVNANGTLVNPSVLPAGLHLNGRTGEVYGVPTAAAGSYTFYVRIANDEGRWISLTCPITVMLAKNALMVDMKDDNTGLGKTYGASDPGFYSNQLAVAATYGAPTAAYDSDGTDITLSYDYSTVKTLRAENEEAFKLAVAAKLKYAPDLNDSEHNFVPAAKVDVFSMALHRASGEDAGSYKLSMTADDVTGADVASYTVTLASELTATELTYDESHAVTTAAEYVFVIAAKPGASYEATVEYGSYASGDDVKEALTGSGLVANGGIKVTDAFQSVALTAGTVSTSGKLKTGTYTEGFTPVIVNTATEKGTSAVNGATTTANYASPAFSLTIDPKALTVTKTGYTIATGSVFTVDSLIKLIKLNSVAGDRVGLIITGVTLGDTTYDITDATQKTAANAALANTAKKPGDYSVAFDYSGTLTGDDAANYSITGGTVNGAALKVTAPVAGGAPSAPPPAAVMVNGKPQTAGTKETGTDANGKPLTTVIVDTDQLEKILESEGEGARVTIAMTDAPGTARGVLTGEMVNAMEQNGATLIIQTGGATYTLPASEINIEAVSNQLGTNVSLADIEVQIDIAAPSAETIRMVQAAASSGDFSVVVPAVDFTITCTYGTTTVEVNRFRSYVERLIAIPSGVDANQITTGVVVQPDGTTRHVPTEVTQIDGVYYAKINSLTNSTYAVVWHPITFADVAKHWAKASVNNMGSRMVVTGYDADTYKPDADITRAEFAAIVVRALGLAVGTGASDFRDVNAADWYCGYIQTAASYGLINGYGNGAFGPNDKITREQAMVIIARAMELTGLKKNLTESEVSGTLATYTDAGAVSGYAKSGAAECVWAKVVSGRTAATVNPKEHITRAEVAVVVERLLQNSGLIEMR